MFRRTTASDNIIKYCKVAIALQSLMSGIQNDETVKADAHIDGYGRPATVHGPLSP